MHEIKLFLLSAPFSLQDIYIYLNNNNNLQNKEERVTEDNDDGTKNDSFIQIEEKRLELIKKCKYIRNLVENEFGANGDDVDSSSYLEMGAVGNGRSCCGASDASKYGN